MQNHFKELLHKQMSRKEFLVTLGFGIATFLGLAALLQFLGKKNPWHSSGYSSGGYGK